ncbi:response regulator [Lacihabitans sp. LS3-19]|uniref:response regulator n=1 Tax=Lacihabitans sp. LS3-19 TaxID=2487335 RepID=UPI0020CD0875|nr:response regulator [Lacihabitans sp. LS3-19]MCP9768115.1 response regulator [Lacihabitans sp. LS3-19]
MTNDPILIILADDDESDRLIFKEAVSELKIQTTIQTVNDGVELMDFLEKATLPYPHILFLDLNMPRKNGLACLKEIRANVAFNEISIAIYSTSASEKDIEETFLNGANVYINKPNDFNKLKTCLEKALMTSFQYLNPPFNRSNFLMRI